MKFSNQFYANHSNSVHDRRRSTHLARKSSVHHTPKNVRISQSQAAQAMAHQGGVSLHDVRELMRPPSHIASKAMAKNGCTVRDIVKATPWDKGRYEK